MSTSVKPLILLSNDDGVRAPGIQALAGALAEVGEVIVAAPDRERSAASHSISLDHPLRVDRLESNVYSIDGTPVDCVYLALAPLVPRKPDLCLSGINNGFNLGSDVFYSGTVGAALEGALRGVPAIALSLERQKPQDFSHAAAFGARLVATSWRAAPRPSSGHPAQRELAGRSRARLAHHHPRPTHLPRPGFGAPGSARSQLLLDRRPEEKGDDLPGSDCTAVREGLVSVTAIGLDLTHRPMLDRMVGWWPGERLGNSQ